MSRVVYRYPLRLKFREPQTIEIERDARIIRTDFVNAEPSLWAIVVPGQPKEKRAFVIRGTGSEFGGNEQYLGTFYTQEVPGGFKYVWHVFEVKQ